MSPPRKKSTRFAVVFLLAFLAVTSGAVSCSQSTAETSWFQNYQTLIAAIVGALAVIIARPTLRRLRKAARARKRSELHEEQEFQRATLSERQDDTERKYIRGLEKEHRHIQLFGFQSAANISVRTLDVFVSLRLTRPRMHAVAGHSEPEFVQEEQGTLAPEVLLKHAFRKNRLLLLIGDPGSGKTTLLRYFALNALDPHGRKKLGLERYHVPIILPLRKVDPGKRFCDALSEWATKKNHEVSPDLFETWLTSRGALVMLDGLDEISSAADRKGVCEWIDNACNAYPGSQFILTSRYSGYKVAEGIKITTDHVQAEVLDLNDEQQEIFLRKWFAAVYRDELEIEGNGEQAQDCDPDEQAGEVSDAVRKFLRKPENESLRTLAGSPVLLQIMAILWKEYRGLVSGRAALYEKATEYLLDRRDRVRGIEPKLPAEQAKILLRPLALMMQESLKTDDLSRTDFIAFLKDRIEEVQPGLTPEDFVKNLCDRSGLIKEFGEQGYIFSHKSFREFLAAGQLAEEIQRQPKRVQVLIRNFDDSWWREPIFFALTLPKPVILPDFLDRFLPDKKHAATFPPLLDQIIREAPQKSIVPFEKILLDGRYSWQSKFNAVMCLRLVGSKAATDLLTRLLERAKDAKLQGRVRDILTDRLGDISMDLQSESGSISILPSATTVEARAHPVSAQPFHNSVERNAEYIRIKGGEFTYSVDKQTVQTDDLYFAKYPVTNKRYRRFIAYLAGSLDDEPAKAFPAKRFRESLLENVADDKEFADYLSKKDNWAELLRSRLDDDKRFNSDDQPVVAVAWYAARAYCHWLTALSQVQSEEGEGETFRLPTETEWEWAASGGERPYPWGKAKPSKEHANYGEQVGQTTPVGAYPTGATPDGLQDVAGNVWEWMENLYRDKDFPAARALRGGSWFDFVVNLQCSARSGIHPVDRFVYGFRVVRAQS